MHRADRRRAEEMLAQLTARRQALEELERDRVGLAPAAAALLAARERFDGGVLGPLSDFVSTGPGRRRAGRAPAGRLDARRAGARPRRRSTPIQAWHAEQQPGALVLLPLDPGPLASRDGQPLDDRLRAEGPAAGWVRAALAGSRGARHRGPRAPARERRHLPVRRGRAVGPAPPPGRARDAGPGRRAGRRRRSQPPRTRAAGHDRSAGRARADAGRRGRGRGAGARGRARRRRRRARTPSASRATWPARWPSPRRSWRA